jgi:hypothetical protein
MRLELNSIEAGFNLLPTLSGNAGKFVLVNAGANALVVSSTLSESGSALTINGTMSGTAVTSLFASPPAIGGTAPAAGTFTTLTVNSSLSGAAVTSLFASPPAIGGTAAASGRFSSVTNTGLTSGRVTYAGASGLLQDSANLTFDGTALTAARFSGPHDGTVGATTPAAGSFTTLSASGNLTLSGLSANSIVYLNGSKVATTSNLLFNGFWMGIGGSFTGTQQSGFTAYASASSAFRLLNSSTGTTNADGVDLELNGLNFSIINREAGNITLQTSGTTALTINSSQVATLANNPVLSGGTANGVTYLDGSKVLTSGSALTFDGSTLLLDKTGAQANVRVKTDTVGAVANAYFNVNGTDYFRIYTAADETGLRNLQNTPIYFSINNSEQMRLTSTGLGIGTSSPSDKLHVASGASTYIRTQNTGASIDAYYGVSGTGAWTGTGTNHPYLFYTNNTERMRLDPSGNLGLGVTPSAWKSDWNALDIETGGIALAGSLAVGAVATNAFLNSSAQWVYKSSFAASRYAQVSDGSHQWHIAPSGTAGNAISFTQAMTLDASGNLALGLTSTSGQRLAISGAMNVPAVNFKDVLSVVSTNSQAANNGAGISLGGVYTGTTQTAFAQIAGIKENSTDGNYDGALAFYTRLNADSLYERARISSDGTFRVKGAGTAGSTDAFQVSGSAPADAARLDSSGNLLVGKTSYGSVAGVGSQLGALGVGIFTAANDAPLYLNRTSSDGFIAAFYKDGTNVGSISVTSTATAYNTSSDYRLKNTIAPMTGALAKVALLKPCTYKWNVDGSDGQGFIAHELAAVCPQAVSGEKDGVDAEGNPQYQGIDTSFLVATLTAAIQEQQALINDLRARVAALEA